MPGKPIKTKTIKKVLIANRGEIAVRITQTLQEMGITVVAVYSDPDAGALHVRKADEAVRLPGETAAETYLQKERLIEICKEHGVDAVHPGYGFLSENADFARLCDKAGIVFIGPKPDVIRDMGDKIIAKTTMEKAGVPVVPGWSGAGIEPDVIRREADRIGYPVLVKAAAGGGGKGMRLVKKPEELEAALEAAAREAQSAFGDARIFLEKYIVRPRHVEFQIFGDEHGNVVHLFERECSIQRRHQKIVEESPSPALTPELRAKMGKAAVKAAQAIGYTNAGTVEFILAPDGSFYFLEVNTRLQVEHPVTEMVTHRDLVRAQLLVAQGEPLPFRQEDLTQEGHAIECRVYAEDPARNFLPSTGKLHHCHPPEGPGIRVDTGVDTGSAVSIHYDPMLAKLVVWGETRQQAIEKARWALDHYAILGVTTNIQFLNAVLGHPVFASGDIHTHFLEENPIRTDMQEIPPEALAVAALASRNGKGNSQAVSAVSGVVVYDGTSPWLTAGKWRAF